MSAFGPFKASYDLRHSVAISSTPDMSQTPYYGGFLIQPSHAVMSTFS